MGFLANIVLELRRRRVLRMMAWYVIAGWGFLQVMDLLFPALGVSEESLRFVWIGLLAGFPLAVIFSWKFDVTAHGIRRTNLGSDDPVIELSLRKTDYALLTVLAVIALFTVATMARQVIESRGRLDLMPETRLLAANTIAVLPLKNLSSNPAYAYFASGMYDVLINSLGKLSGLRVTSSTSASRVGSRLNIPMIGRQLGVSKVIEGTAYRDDDKVRVTVQLIDAISDQHIWAESYERSLDDVVSLQADLARAVANAVNVQISKRDEELLARSLKTRPETFDAYLRGMYQFRRESGPAAFTRGLEILREALEKDPGSALAHAGLARGFSELGHNIVSPEPGAYKKSKAYADRALELDDMLPEAHLAVGMYKVYYEYDWQGGEASLRRALELNPSLLDGWYHLAWYYELFGRDEEALAAGEKTIELSPVSPFYISWLAEQYREAGQVERAMELARRALDLNPDFPIAWMALGNAYSDQGMMVEAIQSHERLVDHPYWSWALARSYALAGMRGEAMEIARRLPQDDSYSIPLVLIHQAMGGREPYLHWLSRAAEIHNPWYPWLLTSFPRMDTPENQQRARELGLPVR